MVSKRVVLADVPRYKKRHDGTFRCSPVPRTERAYMRMFPSTENRSLLNIGQNNPLRNHPFVSSRVFKPHDKHHVMAKFLVRFYIWQGVFVAEKTSHYLPDPSCLHLGLFEGPSAPCITEKYVTQMGGVFHTDGTCNCMSSKLV